MNTEDDEFNRIEREASLRMAAVSATVQKPMHPEIKKMLEDYFDKCFRDSSAQREWVGLTDKERNQLWRDVIKWGDPSHDDVELMKALEKYLKEKNEM
jgi:predicted Fe-S protein YdhL (DUF1289 family)